VQPSEVLGGAHLAILAQLPTDGTRLEERKQSVFSPSSICGFGVRLASITIIPAFDLSVILSQPLVQIAAVSRRHFFLALRTSVFALFLRVSEIRGRSGRVQDRLRTASGLSQDWVRTRAGFPLPGGFCTSGSFLADWTSAVERPREIDRG
jgi:hypothetical protein